MTIECPKCKINFDVHDNYTILRGNDEKTDRNTAGIKGSKESV